MKATTGRVAVLEPGYSDYAVERAILGPLDVEILPVSVDHDALAAIRELDPLALMVRERNVTDEIIEAAPRLKVIVRYGIGVDNIELKSASARKIYVANVPDYGAEHEVSDHAVALYLAVNRRIVSRDREVRGGAWAVGQKTLIPGRRDATLGLIGFGRIARAAAAKFRALGFRRVLASDPLIAQEDMTEADVIGCDVDTLCREADVVSLHAPLLAETRHILHARRIALMKPSSIVVNVSRGGLVDENALAEALVAGRLFGAGIDVFEREPPLPGNPLLHAPNTVLSDHTAWYSEDSVGVLQEKAALEVRRVLEGRQPVNWVNRW